MENPKPTPAPLPFVPSPEGTRFANAAFAEFVLGNGAIFVTMSEVRTAPVRNIGEVPITANFEIARYALSPRALRHLSDSIAATIKAYEIAAGKPLPSIDGFVASAAIDTLLPPHEPQV